MGKDTFEIYAVDFDGTLHLGKWPSTGKPNKQLIDFLKLKRVQGDRVILWTCREGDLLQAAVDYCKDYGLEFDAINDNVQENKDHYKNNCRKVFAHYYIDDRNLHIRLNNAITFEGDITL